MRPEEEVREAAAGVLERLGAPQEIADVLRDHRPPPLPLPRPRRPAPKRRLRGRIMPALREIHDDRFWPLHPRGLRGCAICGSSRVHLKENGREFCFAHRPELAAEALTNSVRYDTRPVPNRRTAERILRLAGWTQGTNKPPRRKRPPRDRRYVR